MDVSVPVFLPAKAATVAIFDPRSKFASFVFSIFTVPVLTSLSTGPELATFTLRWPPWSDAFGGNTTPTAGSIASRSSTGILSPTSFRLTVVTFPCASYDPVKWETACPSRYRIARWFPFLAPGCAPQRTSHPQAVPPGNPSARPLNSWLAAFPQPSPDFHRNQSCRPNPPSPQSPPQGR